MATLAENTCWGKDLEGAEEEDGGGNYNPQLQNDLTCTIDKAAW